MQGPAPELKHTMVRAGAGAGKTTGLVNEVIDVYRRYHQYGLKPRIVLTTFTRKATQELKERLIKKACEAKDADFLQFVTDPSSLQIATIHGLLNIFLKQVGHLAGLDAGFAIMSEGEAQKLARLNLRDTIVAQPNGLTWLEKYQFPLLLRMCRQYEEARRDRTDLVPASIDDLMGASAQIVGDWKKELEEFASSILEEVDEPKWVEFAAQLKAFTGTWTGDSAELERLPKKPRNAGKAQEPLALWHERASILADFKKEMDADCWNRSLWPQMVEQWNEFATLAEDFLERSQSRKDQTARFEMTDLELKSLEILRSIPALGQVFAESWDYWMIDEFQDTSPIQVECLEALIDGKPSYHVGDPQQSIYLFRGAEVAVFDRQLEKTQTVGGELRELRRNYRSEPDLLLWMNEFMATIGPAFAAMEPRGEPTAVERECVKMLRAPDKPGEIRAVVQRVHELIENGADLESICILGRTHRTLMEVSRALRSKGYPTHVHAARGFNQRREVLDAQALWKFLINPHDNLSLLILLRSPWFYVADGQLTEWMSSRPASLWRKLLGLGEEVPESIKRLRAAHLSVGRKGLASTFEDTLCASAMIDLSLVNDPAGRKESNLWKLILRAREVEKEGGESVLNFLSEESGDDPMESNEGDATSAQEPNSINLMTVHGSKGLQFDHVILPYMGDEPQVSKRAAFTRFENRFSFPTPSGAEGETVMSPLDFLDKRQKNARELEEFDRWLYVAITRAKKTLSLTWSEIKRNSWASRSPWFVKAAGLHSGGHFRYEIVEDEFADSPNYRAREQAKAKVRPPWDGSSADKTERHAVTDLIAKKPTGSGQDDLIRRWQAQNRGTRIHRVLEALKYTVEPDMNDPAVKFVVELKSPPMRELIAEGETEWGFQVQTPTQVVEGQIDLWGKHDGKLYVIDYKSGSQKFKDAAFEQLSLYAWALRKFGHVEPAELVVIYPLTGKVEIKKFDEELFRGWELKFGGTQA